FFALVTDLSIVIFDNFFDHCQSKSHSSSRGGEFGLKYFISQIWWDSYSVVRNTNYNLVFHFLKNDLDFRFSIVGNSLDSIFNQIGDDTNQINPIEMNF